MSAFIVFHSTIKNQDLFRKYAAAVGPTLSPFDGVVVQKGKAARVLQGEHDHHSVGILQFPDLESAHGWYESDSYQSLIPNRNAAADLTVISYVQPDA